MLPVDIQNLILDYYWSHKVYLLKRKCLKQLNFNRFFREVNTYYDMYHTITLNLSAPYHTIQLYNSEQEFIDENEQKLQTN